VALNANYDKQLDMFVSNNIDRCESINICKVRILNGCIVMMSDDGNVVRDRLIKG
jgi:hypothetical protein